MTTPRIVGLGEVLWDMLPDGSRLGGAPANFTVHAGALGADAVLASAVGEDELGREARAQLSEKDVNLRWLQTSQLPTSRVVVSLDAAGHATYTIEQPVAWDALRCDAAWRELAQTASAVCFGTLCQRDARSANAIQEFLQATREECVRIFDVNLRPPFYNAAIIRSGLSRASLVKVNEHELPVLLSIAGAPSTGQEALDAAALLDSVPNLQAVCVTLGERGSLMALPGRQVAHAGYPARVVDTIGAGDAFTAALAWYWLKGAEPVAMLAAANRLGGYVASRAGAMPELSPELRVELDTLAGAL